MSKKPYCILGIAIGLMGITSAAFFYFAEQNMPLSAVGLTAVLLGITIFILGLNNPGIPAEYFRAVQAAENTNTEKLLQIIGTGEKAVYVPSAGNNRYPQVVIKTNSGNTVIAVPGVYGISLVANMLGSGTGEMESAARCLLTGIFDVARSVNLSRKDNEIFIEIGRSKLSFENRSTERFLGSPAASLCAVLVCESLQKPVCIKQETREKNKDMIVIEVLD